MDTAYGMEIDTVYHRSNDMDEPIAVDSINSIESSCVSDSAEYGLLCSPSSLEESRNERYSEEKLGRTFETYTTFTPTKMNILEIDMWDVKKLDQDIGSVSPSVPSVAIQRMLELRRKRSELSNSNMMQDVQIINDITEKCFTKISEHFKNLLESFKTALAEKEKSVLENKAAFNKKKDFVNALDDAVKLFTYRRNIINLYCQRVMQVEHIRSEKIKLVLRFYMNSFNKIAHHLPRDIQRHFENQILKFNEAMMGNVRCYGEIHLQLVTSGDSQFLKLKRKIDYVEYLWECDQLRAKTVNEDRKWMRYSGTFASVNLDESDEIRDKLKGNAWTEQLFQAVVCKWAEYPDIPNAMYNVIQWSEELLGIIMHLDLCAQKIIFLLKSALVNLLRGMELDFEILQYASLEEDFATCTCIYDVHLIFAAVTYKIKNMSGLSENNEKWDMNMTNMILLMEQNSDITKDFLVSAAKLWDLHFQRINKCSRLVASGVKRHNEDRKEIDNLEMLYNIEVDRLRQESAIEKLDSAMHSIHSSLDRIVDHYQAECETEWEILGNYPQLLEIELQLFKSEVEQFVIKHPKVEVTVDLQDSQEENLTVEADEKKDSAVPKHIKKCIFQLEAAENWKLGLYECMEHYASSCRDEFLADAGAWVNTLKKVSENHLLVKKALLKSRYERIRLEVYNVRLVELQQHRASLEAHQLAVETYLTDFMDKCDKFAAEQIDHAKDFVSNLETTISKRDIDVLESNTVSYLIKKTDVDCEKFVSRIKGFVLDMKVNCSRTVKWLKESTVNFAKSIKMFSEGGNFSAAEAKEMLRELTLVDKFLGVQGGKAVGKIDADGSALLGKVMDMLCVPRQTLKNLYDDLILIERTSKKIQWLQRKIETEVSNLNEGSVILKDKVSGIEATMKTAAYPVEMVLEKWYELLDNLQQRNEYLFKAEGSKAKLTVVSLGIQTTPSSSDYRYFLGWDQPTESNRFLDCIRLNVWDTLGEIQDLAHKFYLTKSEKNIVKSKDIPFNFRDFMDQVLEKFKFYLIQCEEAWLDQLRDYLVLVTQIREMANAFIKLAIEGFRTDQVGKLDTARSTFSSYYAVKSQDQAKQRAEMDRSLMPLYGYPGNRKMLLDLRAQVMKGFENLVKSAMDDFFAHRENLKEIHATYDPNLNNLLAAISEFSKKVFDIGFSKNVALQLDEICEDSMKIFRMDLYETSRPVSAVSKKTNDSHSSVDQISLIEIPSDTVIRKEIPGKYKLRIKYNSIFVVKVGEALKNLLSHSIYFDNEVELVAESETATLDHGFGVDLQPHVNSIVSLGTEDSEDKTGIYFVAQRDFGEIVSNTYKEYTRKRNDHYQKLTTEIIGYKLLSKEWLQNWKENVKRVKKLYTVTYDSEKISDIKL